MAEGVGEQPRFGGYWVGVSGIVCKLVCLSFYFFVEAFDSIPIPVCDVLESEALATECFLKLWRAINEF
ncbi:hypothetical protein GCM10009021_30880 [Halarchaeum nitratireducens]|uniref:Uncharacterized protein n=1 Tax=Halarchaeum nitratireducens TaxID=489913 RepID=A0A830GED1_9EURY|nr:hypothetical protein GCM10009021_30880 [Halarchaeum nitratireducens]